MRSDPGALNQQCGGNGVMFATDALTISTALRVGVKILYFVFLIK
jgi:hypothetical protein